jgi:CheY-like chemotaxis protein
MALIAVAPSRSDTPPATILVVEDDAAMRELLRRMLERKGFSVETAADGCDGLKRLRAGGARIMITDMMMPRMDGLELIRALCAEHPNIRIIAISGAEEHDQYLRQARKLGAKAVLRKPIGSAELVDAIRLVLSSNA